MTIYYILSTDHTKEFIGNRSGPVAMRFIGRLTNDFTFIGSHHGQMIKENDKWERHC